MPRPLAAGAAGVVLLAGAQEGDGRRRGRLLAPTQGDGFDGPSRFNRHRMYYEGMQMYRPNQRPFALHRNASAGVPRVGGFIWSGDVENRWETLAMHVPNAITRVLPNPCVQDDQTSAAEKSCVA